MLGNYRVSKQLGISRVVLSSMELVSYTHEIESKYLLLYINNPFLVTESRSSVPYLSVMSASFLDCLLDAISDLGIDTVSHHYDVQMHDTSKRREVK
jgi:hypothetical protein